MARTDAEHLAALLSLRDQVTDRLSEMVSKPRPTYDVDGQKMDFTEYQKMLFSQLKALRDEIAIIADAADDHPGMTETSLVTGP